MLFGLWNGNKNVVVATARNNRNGRGTGPGHLAWGVVTAGPPSRFALAGNYTGPGAGFALGDGFNANSLVGGYGNSISLQPLSAGGSPGINLSAGIGALSLQPTAPPRQLRYHG
ncbi:MAG: DUF992 domain-containing protein [Methylocella sp.]